jgi:hypothetical protein
LLFDRDAPTKTVRSVSIVCGANCATRLKAREQTVNLIAFHAVTDLFETLERLIHTAEWERGTVTHLAHILSSLSRARRAERR